MCRLSEAWPAVMPASRRAGRTCASGERYSLGRQLKRWAYPLWVGLICGFASLHAVHLDADFPNHSPWIFDFAKYTDEGWWGNAAVRAHLYGNWYLRGDFNPAAATPVWPFLEWIVFCFMGVSVEAARGLAVSLFFANLLLSYLLVRVRGPRWVALLAMTLIVSSPFVYCFSRLAILEPLLITLTLAALNLTVRLPRFRHPMGVSLGIGVLFTLMLLTKTTAVFLLPAIAWAMFAPLWKERRVAIGCAVGAGTTAAVTFAIWMGLIAHYGLMRDYLYLFYINKYDKPAEFYWPLLSLGWALRGALWVDRILIPLAGLVIVASLLVWKSGWSRKLRHDPVFCSSLLAVLGYILFMTYQNHPQPRYYAVVAFFAFIELSIGIGVLLERVGPIATAAERMREFDSDPWENSPRGASKRLRGAGLGYGFLAAVMIAGCVNGDWTLYYALHPEYTFIPAVRSLTRFIDQHPGGKRLLVATSGDEITMISHLPTICDDFGTEDLPAKLKEYQPGWFATWNELDPGTLEDLHNHFSLEQVATFRAFDHPDRNVLVLFRLHPWPGEQVREPQGTDLQAALPEDKINVPIE